MASTAFLVAVIVAVALSPAMAMNYTVGDGEGWKLGVNYTAWAAGKDFRVGDTITFTYKQGAHNVYKVTGADFQMCNTSNSLGGPLTSGNDVVTLATPGRKWYICGVADHCVKGMKLVFTVSDDLAPTPNPNPGMAPAPTPGATGTPGTPGSTGTPGTPGVTGTPGTPNAPSTPGTSSATQIVRSSIVWLLAAAGACTMVVA